MIKALLIISMVLTLGTLVGCNEAVEQINEPEDQSTTESSISASVTSE